MAMLDGILPGSDPTTPNAFVQSPQQIAQQQALAQALIQQGSSTAPIASPWQGVANLAKALMGGWQAGQAQQAQRLGTADDLADQSNSLNRRGFYNDPGNTDIPSTPGHTTAALAQNDAINDAVADAQDAGADPRRAALVAALGGTSQGGMSGNPALAAALGGAPAATAPFGTQPAGNGVNGLARGMRNNNPGNLESNSWTANLPGYAGSDGRFAIFSSPQAGAAALDANLKGYGARGIVTPLAIASTWAPGSEAGNNPNSYGAVIARTLGVGLNDPVNMSDPATRAKIGQAIALVENGPGGSQAPALAAINAATGAGGTVPSAASAYAATPTAAAAPTGYAYAMPTNAPGGRLNVPAAQGDRLQDLQQDAADAGMPSTLQAGAGGNLHLASPGNEGAIYDMAAQPWRGFGQAAAPAPAGAGAATNSQPTPAVTASMSGHPADAPASAISPSAAPSSTYPMQGDISDLLRIISNPWSSPAAQQVAQTLLQSQMPGMPQVEKIKDADGSEHIVFVNPRTQQITTPPGQASGISAPLVEPGGAPETLPALPRPPSLRRERLAGRSLRLLAALFRPR